MLNGFVVGSVVRRVLWVACFSSALLLSGCQGDDQPSVDPDPELNRVTVSIAGQSGNTLRMDVGDTVRLNARAFYSDDTNTSVDASQVVWDVRREGNGGRVIEINSGTLNAVSSGTAYVQAVYKTIPSEETITVVVSGDEPPPPECVLSEIDVSGPAVLDVGASGQYTALGVCDDGATQLVSGVVWTSSKTTVATIGRNSGNAMAIAEGETTIKAVVNGVSGELDVTIEGDNLPPPTVKLEVSKQGSDAGLCPGKTLQLAAKYTIDASESDVTTSANWSVNNSAVATVDDGVLTALKAGTVTVSASYLGAIDSSPETVTIGECGLTLYVKKPSSWASVNIYAWDDAATPNQPAGAWPGGAMEKDGSDDWYKRVFVGAEKLNVIFNNGGTEQTVDYKGRTANGWCELTPAGKTATCVWHDKDPRKPSEVLDLDVTPADTSFTDSVTATIKWNAAVAKYCRYTTDGTNPVNAGSNCQSSVSNLGKTLAVGQKVTLTVCGADNTSTPCVTRVYTKANTPPPAAFTWDNATVYFVVTDRFHNGDQTNDESYGRKKNDGDQNVGTWHGGDLAGLTAKINEGYFSNLGVNALWITAPYEQIHGWVKGGNGSDFKHYGYHGYWVKDYTVLDKNMGTISGARDDMRTFVDAAHAKGIRVLFDIVMNHPGYYTPQDLAEDGVQVLKRQDWQNLTLANYGEYIDYDSQNFTQAWGGDWVRIGSLTDTIPGHDPAPCGNVDSCPETFTLNYLPDFKTESSKSVDLPAFLKRKADTKAQYLANHTPRKYLVKWLSDWVRTYGIDGFRCDTAKHVEKEGWAELKNSAAAALREWKQNNPNKKLDDLGFWMVGEHWDHGAYESAYFNYGFDAMINFAFQEEARGKTGSNSDMARMDGLYAGYANLVNNSSKVNLLSYISSHDEKLFAGDGDQRDRYKRAAGLLLMTPGAVQIYYGDENARRNGPSKSDPDQGSRSDMNFSENADVLAHWQKIGQFRQQHIAVGAGQHKKMGDAPYHFARTTANDKVVVAFGAQGTVNLSVSGVFEDGALVKDAYTGKTATVSGGKVSIAADSNGVVLLSK
jgi:alpha-amylase